jgi:CubicO group peptidase (beta-lactamase class C family)
MNEQEKSPATALTATCAVIEQGIADGLHIGAQVYVSIDGEPRAELALGLARPGVPMTPDTLMLWLSCSKPIGAVAIAQLWEQGKLHLDDPVIRHIPEFGQNGKETVTIRHILTHTAGFRWVETGAPAAPREQIIARICAARQERDWQAGKKAGYSPSTSWFILGEIVRRLDGRDYARYVRDEIFLPLDMQDCWIALPADRYRAYGDRIGIMHKTDKPGGAVDSGLDAETSAGATIPGGGGRGPARELGRFYEMLLRGGKKPADELGPGALLPQTIEALTARHRTGMKDATFNHVMDWGLGFIVNSAIYGPDSVPYGFGPDASARTYGHGGSQSSVSFADPEHGLTVVVIFNGMAGEPAHQKRIRQALSAIYQDLGLGAKAMG